MIFNNVPDLDWIGFNFIRSGLDSDWKISQSDCWYFLLGVHFCGIFNNIFIATADSRCEPVYERLKWKWVTLILWQINCCTSDYSQNVLHFDSLWTFNRGHSSFTSFVVKKPRRMLSSQLFCDSVVSHTLRRNRTWCFATILNCILVKSILFCCHQFLQGQN